MIDQTIAHYAYEAYAFKPSEDGMENSYQACRWDDEEACNFEATMYLIHCPANWQDNEPEQYDEAWDSKEEVCEISGNNRGIVQALQEKMANHYPDAIQIDNDYF